MGEYAHIRAVKNGGPDDVRNMIPLCQNHHWTFDRGLITIDDDLCVIVSKEAPECLRDLHKQPMLLPSVTLANPWPEYVAYHREHTFEHWAEKGLS